MNKSERETVELELRLCHTDAALARWVTKHADDLLASHAELECVVGFIPGHDADSDGCEDCCDDMAEDAAKCATDLRKVRAELQHYADGLGQWARDDFTRSDFIKRLRVIADQMDSVGDE